MNLIITESVPDTNKRIRSFIL